MSCRQKKKKTKLAKGKTPNDEKELSVKKKKKEVAKRMKQQRVIKRMNEVKKKTKRGGKIYEEKDIKK